MDRFLIAPFQSGLDTSLKAWIIPDEAFEEIYNAYVFRGRVRKRFGTQLMGASSTGLTAPLLSRLRVNVGTTDGAGDFTPPAVIPTGATGAKWKIGQMFSIGSTIFTVYQAAGAMLTTGAATGTFDTATGTLEITGNTENPLTTIYWYPSEPVMGLTVYDAAGSFVNDQPPFAFDTRFAYTYSGGWSRSGTGVTPIWNGTNLNYFWTWNWRGITPDIRLLFVTNFNATRGVPGASDDPMWYYDGTNWVIFSPYTVFLADGSYVQTAKIIVAFKGTLLLLNTIERIAPSGANTNKQFVNRCRYSINGAPNAQTTVVVGADTANSPYSWLEPGESRTVTVGAAVATGKAAGAGFIDAATDEQIVSAGFIKDRLIVYFERSTWELVWTGNYSAPFYWQRINSELGSVSTFSSVEFDKQVLSVSNTGITGCTGANVERIDNKVPDQIYSFKDKASSISRVAGIRDFYAEMVYWSFVSRDLDDAQTYPDNILVYNYKNDTWALNEDCFTAFGYWEQSQDLTWGNTITTWEESDFTWRSNILESPARQIIAGNQQGFVVVVNPDESRNAPYMQITNMSYNAVNEELTLTIYDHTLSVDEDEGIGNYIFIENAQGVTIGGTGIYKVKSITVGGVTDPNVVIVGPVTSFAGTYTGGGTATRVSNISIYSKQWNPYDKEARNVNLSKIDFLVGKTSAGEITVDYFPSSTRFSMIDAGGFPLGTGANVGTNVLETSPSTLYPLENLQKRLWKPVYFLGEGECIQIWIHWSAAQMVVRAISLSPFELHALMLHVRKSSDRLQ